MLDTHGLSGAGKLHSKPVPQEDDLPNNNNERNAAMDPNGPGQEMAASVSQFISQDVVGCEVGGQLRYFVIQEEGAQNRWTASDLYTGEVVNIDNSEGALHKLGNMQQLTENGNTVDQAVVDDVHRRGYPIGQLQNDAQQEVHRAEGAVLCSSGCLCPAVPPWTGAQKLL